MQPFQFQPIDWSLLARAGSNARQNSLAKAQQNLYSPQAWQANVTYGAGQPQQGGGFADKLMSLGRMFGLGR